MCFQSVSITCVHTNLIYSTNGERGFVQISIKRRSEESREQVQERLDTMCNLIRLREREENRENGAKRRVVNPDMQPRAVRVSPRAQGNDSLPESN